MKSLFEVNEVYAVFGYRSHQADMTHWSGLFWDDFYSAGHQHYALACKEALE